MTAPSDWPRERAFSRVLRRLRCQHRVAMIKTARSCIFCDAPADRHEHLLPRWLQSVLPSEDPALHYRQIGTDESERQEWVRQPFRETARVVCEACNSGWMSNLEQASKPLLTPLIMRTEPLVQLPPNTQRIVATWAFKTILVFQASQGESVAPPFHCAFLRAHRVPPAQVFLWISSNYGARFNDAAMAYVQRPLTLTSPDGRFEDVNDFGYTAFLAIGSVSFVLIGHRYRNQVDVKIGNMMTDALTRLWPASDGQISWPPELMMDKQLVDTLFIPVTPPTLDVRVSSVA